MSADEDIGDPSDVLIYSKGEFECDSYDYNTLVYTYLQYYTL